jgi:hypothetical protein
MMRGSTVKAAPTAAYEPEILPNAKDLRVSK